MSIVEIKCPGCNAAVDTSQKKCMYCKQPLVFKSFGIFSELQPNKIGNYVQTFQKILSENPNNMEINHSLGLCYLKLKLYDKALTFFEDAMVDNYNCSESYFYAAICLLNGKKAFLQMRPTIDKILEYINAALMIEHKAMYYYYLSYIKYDYFERKYFNIIPNYKEELSTSYELGLSELDKIELYTMLGIEKPELL